MGRDAASFEEVKKEETALIAQARMAAGLSAEQPEEDLFGLAFSGGGIRSATFNLGVIQALARARLLSRVDYLSTVSGGGYIGSWLSAWIHCCDGRVSSVQEALAGLEAKRPEPVQVSWLRRFSNYLTPRVGLFSTDTLAGVATYVRNLLLNLLAIVALLGAVLILPLLAGWVLKNIAAPWLPLGALAFALALFFIDLNLYQSDVERGRTRFYQSRRGVFWLVVAPLLLGAAALGFAASKMADARAWEFLGAYFPPALVLGIGLQIAAWLTHKRIAQTSFAAVGTAIKEAIGNLGKRGEAIKPAQYSYGPTDWLRIALAVVAAVAVGLLGMWIYRQVLHADAVRPDSLLHATVWAMPVSLLAFGVATILFVGISGRTFSEETREWWSRLGGWVIGLTLGWLAVACSAIYGPYLLGLLRGWVGELGAAWVVSTVAGVLAGRSRLTAANGGRRWLEWVATIVPYVFALGLLLALAYCLHGALLLFGAGAESGFRFYPDFDAYSRAAAGLLEPRQLVTLLAALAALIAVVLGLALTVDVNVFSFHMFYRNRLVRCYLGASSEAANKRSQHPFTGFDPADAPRMADLAHRPYHLINTALNLTRSKNLAWQERKAASFVIAPLFCGYDLEPQTGERGDSYQRTAEYLVRRGSARQASGGWLSLGTALTISGAAASPNMGYHSSVATAFLLTIFNVRLGWWMQNPGRRDFWGRKGPIFGIQWLVRELFGMTDESRPFVYLSDGGHFENLGIYELVRRRCRFILAVDAGQDREFRFQDLGNAVRKCGVDLRSRIEISTRAIVPDAQTGRSPFHCAVGEIHYPDASAGPRTGLLLYIKPSLTGNEPADVFEYARTHPDFPHESTADQWFAESQFESYRKLGEHVVSTVLESVAEREERLAAVVDAPGSDGQRPRDLEWIFVNLKERWYPPSRVANVFTRHGEQFKLIEETLRKDENLRFMDAQLVPEWPELLAGRSDAPEIRLGLPKLYAELRAGFYLCTSMLQLMENVYLDLNLEEEWGHPDNRGWMNLFRHWSWSAMFMVTFAICCGMYCARFQRWCERRLDLRAGQVEARVLDVPGKAAGTEQWLSDLEKGGKINFVEAAKLKEYLKAGDRLVLLQLERNVSPPFPVHRGGEGPLLVCTFGVAAAREFATDRGRQHRLTFFRIQDHVRRMGLARRAMRALVHRSPVRVEESALDNEFPQKEQIERILRSVLRETPVAQ